MSIKNTSDVVYLPIYSSVIDALTSSRIVLCKLRKKSIFCNNMSKWKPALNIQRWLLRDRQIHLDGMEMMLQGRKLGGRSSLVRIKFMADCVVIFSFQKKTECFIL